MARIAETVNGFSESVIDAACRAIEAAPQADLYRKMPTLDELTKACQTAARANRPPSTPPFDHDAYMRDVRAHRENYISVADCVREVLDKRMAEGKPVWAYFDPKAGDAA